MAARTLENLKNRYSRSVSAQGGPGGGPRGPMGHGKGRKGTGKPKNVKNTVSRLLKYISEQKILLAVVFVFMLIKTGTALAGSYMVRPIINKFLDSSSTLFGRAELFLQALIILAAVYIAGTVASYFQSRIMLKVSQNALEKIRNDLF